jgi:hypothetical protein
VNLMEYLKGKRKKEGKIKWTQEKIKRRQEKKRKEKKLEERRKERKKEREGPPKKIPPNWHPTPTSRLVPSCHRQDSFLKRLLPSPLPPVNPSPAIDKTLPWRTSCHPQDLALAHEPLELRLATRVAASSAMCPSLAPTLDEGPRPITNN